MLDIKNARNFVAKAAKNIRINILGVITNSNAAFNVWSPAIVYVAGVVSGLIHFNFFAIILALSAVVISILIAQKERPPRYRLVLYLDGIIIALLVGIVIMILGILTGG